MDVKYADYLIDMTQKSGIAIDLLSVRNELLRFQFRRNGDFLTCRVRYPLQLHLAHRSGLCVFTGVLAMFTQDETSNALPLGADASCARPQGRHALFLENSI